MTEEQTAVEREREWLAEQYSKEREAYWEADTVCLTEPDSFTSVDVVTTIVRTRVAARAELAAQEVSARQHPLPGCTHRGPLPRGRSRWAR